MRPYGALRLKIPFPSRIIDGAELRARLANAKDAQPDSKAASENVTAWSALIGTAWPRQLTTKAATNAAEMANSKSADTPFFLGES